MKPEYIGWVPCLSGSLLFQYTELGLGQSDIFLVNYLNRNVLTGVRDKRYIVASSICDWKDSIGSRENGVFRVVISGSVIEQEDGFAGIAYLIPRKPASNCAQSDTGENQLQQEMASLVAMSRAPDDEAFSMPIREFVDSECEKIITGINNKFIHKVAFHIDSKGLTYLAYAGQKAPSATMFEVPELPSIEQRIHKYTLCRQVFYYLKYLLHRHRHHDRSNDSLTTVHSILPDNKKNANNLMDDLKRGLVDIKRAARHGRKDLSGIAEYGKSLVLCCSNKGWIKEQQAENEQALFRNLAASITLLCNRNVAFGDGIKNIILVSYQLMAIVFLFLTPFLLISFHQRGPDPSHGGTSLPNFLMQIVHGNYSVLLAFYLCIVAISILVATLLHINPLRTFMSAVVATHDWTRLRSFSDRRMRFIYLLNALMVFFLNMPKLLVRMKTSQRIDVVIDRADAWLSLVIFPAVALYYAWHWMPSAFLRIVSELSGI